MEQKMKCPHCGRCIGFVQSTDNENSVFSITKSEPKIVGKNKVMIGIGILKTIQKISKKEQIIDG